MKVRARLISSCASLFLLGLTYGFWAGLKIRYSKAIGLLPDRIVIFGNDYSGIPVSTVHKRTPGGPPPVHTWSQALCTSIHASCDSFAPSELRAADDGSAVDNVVFNSTAPDLRDQVDRWIERERALRRSGNAAERSSMFTVFFGINDVWKYSKYDRAAGEAAVEASLDSMFEQLRRVAANWPDPVQVLIPNVIDVTMLPAWAKHRQPRDNLGTELRNAVHLVKMWNRGLKLRARKYSGVGSVFLWDFNRWFMETWRRGGWLEVKEGCKSSGDRACERPETYLMWDDLHLGSKAHELMASEIIKAIEGY